MQYHYCDICKIDTVAQHYWQLYTLNAIVGVQALEAPKVNSWMVVQRLCRNTITTTRSTVRDGAHKCGDCGQL